MSFTVSIFKYKTDLGNLPTSAIVKTAVGRPYLCFILALKASYCNRIASRLQNSWFFFLRTSKEIGKAWRKSLARAQQSARALHARRACEARASLPSLSLCFQPVPDLLFDCSRVLEYAKYGLFCSLNCKTHSDISKLTETRKNRGTEKRVLLPCNNKKNSANNNI